MIARKYNARLDYVFFIAVLLMYLVGQWLIGSYLPSDNSFHYDAPADIDFLYYAGIIQQMQHSFPPQNPAYGGETLSQSFVQYYPTAMLALLVNPYLAMRIMNVICLLLMAYVLRRYFPKGWGIGLALITAGSVGFGLINSLGIDLIARGFNHFPFFIALIVGLFEREKKWLKYGSLLSLGWLHSFSGMLAFLYFAAVVIAKKFSRESITDAGLCLIGLLSAAAITLGVADKPFYFPFVEGFGPDLTNLWMHALPALLMVALANRTRLYLLYLIAFIFGWLFHYNPFFPVFILYFAAGWAAMEIIARRPNFSLAPVLLAVLLLAGFIYSAVGKYDPRQGNFVPIIDPDYAEAGHWLEENTSSDAVIMVLPLESGENCRLMEKRAVYLGFIPHVAHLGIDWRARGQKIVNYFLQPSVYMAETDYVVYGAKERKLFPDFDLGEMPVYRKGSVKIWKLRR